MMNVLQRAKVTVTMACVLSAPAAFAQNELPQVFRTGQELLAAPGQYLNKPIAIVVGYCFYDDTQSKQFFCIGDSTPFEVEAPAMSAGPLLDAIKDKCGDIQGIEHNPSQYCAVSFKFVPTSYKVVTGDYVVDDQVRSNRQIVHFDAEVLTPFK